MATQYVQPGDTSLPSPSASDDIITLGGSAVIDQQMDWSGVTDAAIVEVSAAFNGQFGTPAAPFKSRVSDRIVYAAQGGDFFFVSDGSASDVSTRLLHLGSGHFHFDTTGTLTDVECVGRGGTLTVGTSVTITNLYISGGTIYFYDDGSTDPTLVQQHGGNLLLQRGVTTLNHSAGQTTIDAGTNTITTLSLFGHGLTLTESGTITTLNCWGGIPSVQNLTRQVTISTTNINLSLPGAREFLANPNITFSATNEFLGR